MPISNPDLALECVRGRAADPVCVGRRERCVVELRLIADDHLGAVGHDPKDVAGATAPKPETAPLSAGEVRDDPRDGPSTVPAESTMGPGRVGLPCR